MAEDKLRAAVERAMAGRHDDDTWTELVVSTVRLAAAFFHYDEARKAYSAAHPKNPA